MIHVCFGLHDQNGRYSKFTGTAILSLLENTSSEVTIHILHDNTLSHENHDKFIYLVGRYGQHVEFYNVEKIFLQKFPEASTFPDKFQSLYSPATMYRFLIPHVFSAAVDKVIYLDSDIVVNLDIEELWRVRLGANPLGAVEAVRVSDDVTAYIVSLAEQTRKSPELRLGASPRATRAMYPLSSTARLNLSPFIPNTPSSTKTF